MALNNTDIETLQQIVNLRGNCLDSKRCSSCPFRGICLPDFIRSGMPSKEKRLRRAEEVLTFHHIFGDALIQKEEEESHVSKK
jgi:hypothetical protein